MSPESRRRTPGRGTSESALGRLVARHRRHVVARAVAGACQRFMGWHANVNYDLETNGEAFVLDTVGHFSPTIVFDVGANVGDWSEAAAARCPTAVVHAFEVSPPTFARLHARLGSYPRIRCEPRGLSDAAGEVRLRHFDDAPALTTATDYPHPLPSVPVAGLVERGDDYAARAGLDRIDLLKIDVEGMEERVLRGFGGMFRHRAIDLVQFEYGRVNILNHFLLSDAYAFFRQHGYVVGKIYPSYVDFRDYDLGDEDFRGPNYLACRADRDDYVRALGPGRGRAR